MLMGYWSGLMVRVNGLGYCLGFDLGYCLGFGSGYWFGFRFGLLVWDKVRVIGLG